MYAYTNEWMNALVGKAVVGIDVAEGEEALRFRCDDGTTIVWDTYGDCCSETWWADGFSLNELRGAVVLEVTDIEMPEVSNNDPRSRQEVDEVYGVEIVTERGAAKFAFRNSSNGYYGGSAGLGEDSEAWKWREITENDWQG